MADKNEDAGSRALELLLELLSNDALVASFARGEISRDFLVNELTARYHRGIGSAVNSLAEHNKEVAQQVGQRLRDRLDELLAALERRDEPVKAAKPRRTAQSDTLRDRDDAVLLREYVILKALSKTDAAYRSSEVFGIVRGLYSGVQDDTITAHLTRMATAGVIGKERKGRYNRVPAGDAHLGALTKEIEARGLTLPEVPSLPAD